MLPLKNRPWFKFWPKNVPYHVDYPEIPLFQFLTNVAQRSPKATAFSCRELTLSYRQLDTITTKLASALTTFDIKKRDRVAIILHNSLQFVIGYYGIMKTGAIVVPLNPLLKARELQQSLHDARVKLIITSGEFLPLVEKAINAAKVGILVMPDNEKIISSSWIGEIIKDEHLAPVEVDIKPRQNVAIMLYTGGTTGMPKGVMLTHYNLVANAIQNAIWFGWSEREVVIGVLPFYHTWGGCTCINSPVYAGARVVILPRFDVKELLETIERERATVLYGAASLFTVLINSPLLSEYDLSSLRYVKAGAMPIPVEIKEKWEKLTGIRMVLGYGLTEASPETHNSPFERVKPGTIGIPALDTDARIVDVETGKYTLPIGKVGELLVKGPQVMKGYWQSPEETKAVLRRGWLHTGDLAVMDEEGYFQIVDRKKDIIKYKGYNIAPAELEGVLYTHPSVKECAVIGKQGPIVGEIPVAYVVLKEGYQSTETELIQFCEQRLAPYKKIREVHFVNEIPKTPVGKILRRLLRGYQGTCSV